MRRRSRQNTTTGLRVEVAMDQYALPISHSIAKLDAQYPWLAVVNRENWDRIGFKPTMKIEAVVQKNNSE